MADTGLVTAKRRSVIALALAEVFAMSLWFVSAAILPDMLREVDISALRQAALSSSVQAGFVAGALVSAITGLSDRLDPRKLICLSALASAGFNICLLTVEPGSLMSIGIRFLTGMMLAGVYPPAMKIVAGWGIADRGLLVGILVGALTLGTASPHFPAILGGTDWQMTVVLASFAAAGGALLLFAVDLGPHHATAARFRARSILTAWTNRGVRLAYIGYFGHMWELYVMWAWIAAATPVSHSATLALPDAEHLARITALVAIGAGAVACVFGGLAGDRIGKAETTIFAMSLSGLSALAVALTFGGPAWLTFLLAVIWGITIIPDSAQFSALVVDAAPPETAGSLLTLQTAIGFGMTIFTVQIAPVAAAEFGWALVLGSLAVGPAVGIVAMTGLRRRGA